MVYGKLTPFMEEEKNLIGFFREGEKRLLVLANFQKEPRNIAVPGRMEKVLLNNLDAFEMNGESLLLEAYQFVVVEMKP